MTLKSVQERYNELLAQAAEVAAQESRRNAPVDTGNLRRRIDVRKRGEAYVIASTAPYAKYQKPDYLIAGIDAARRYLRRNGAR